MHDINYTHHHELDEHDFLGCCRDCRASLNIIKPHIMAFADRIHKYSEDMLAELAPDALYRLYQLLDDLAHMDAGDHLAALILDEPDIKQVLPLIRSYYAAFFTIHEKHLAEKLITSDSAWDVLKSFPLYPRYRSLVKTQMELVDSCPGSCFVFIGAGPVPMTQILMARLYGIHSIGLDTSEEAVGIARQVIEHLGLTSRIQLVLGDDTLLGKLEWDMAVVAALSEPKTRIFNTLGRILKDRSITHGGQHRHVPVIYRTYTGMRAVLYEPVKSEDVRGFTTIRQIFPTGRVNNTSVLAELAR